MNKKISQDAEFCGKVPLHQTNLVQPHGILLILDSTSYKILQASENVQTVFGIPAAELVNHSLLDFIPSNQAEKLKLRSASGISGKLPLTLTFSSGDHLALIQPGEKYLIAEIEIEKRSPSSEDSFIQIYQELKFVMAAVESASSIEETVKVAITELKKISGFDKIMIYKFDEEWNGDVIAEVKEEGMDSYMGLKFPASDIPKQARELYRKTAYRLIPNVEYTPVRLYPVINPLTQAFTDLSYSNLRSVAGVHLEYLRNMKVVASMSTRILVDGKLWGLIACHHRVAKYLSFELCSLFELLSQVISSKIASVQKEEIFAYKDRMNGLYKDVVEEIYKDDLLATGLKKRQEELLTLLNADGAILVMDRHLELFGRVPDEAELDDLLMWLRSLRANKLYQQTNLVSEYEPAGKYAGIASGILVLPIQPEKGNFIIAFRPEAVRKLNWSGNPNESIQFEKDQKNYHPRNSFKLWQETVQQTSIPWTTEEMEVAEQFRNFVVEFTLNHVSN